VQRDDVPADLWDILVCPACRRALEQTDADVRCTGCGTRYPWHSSGALDLRLQSPLTAEIPVTLGLPVDDSLAAVSLDPRPDPAVDLTGFPLPDNVSARFASWLPAAPSPGSSRVLDLGCGGGPDRPLLEHAGYRWYGIDYFDERAPLFADAHALPFADGSFDLLFSIAVLESLAHPYRAMQEALRVLRPGGRLVASVAFLTPYIPMAQFHWTHVGVLNTVQAAGFEIEALLADRNWSLLEAGASLGLFPRMPDRAIRALVAPLKLLHRFWWWLGARRAERPLPAVERVLRNAGDIEVVARKPA